MVPSEWRNSVIVPIPKKRGGGVCKVNEFQGISLVSVPYKAMCSIIHGRLAQVVEGRNLVAEEQGGFRRGRGCRDQLLTLVLLGQMKTMSERECLLQCGPRGMMGLFQENGDWWPGCFLPKSTVYMDVSGEVKIGEVCSFRVVCGPQQGR